MRGGGGDEMEAEKGKGIDMTSALYSPSLTRIHNDGSHLGLGIR